MTKRVILLACLFFSPTWSVLVKFIGLNCNTVDPSFCTFENCIMKPVSRGVKEINGRVKLLQVPVTNVSVRMELKPRGNSRLKLYSAFIDGCRFWSTKRRNPFANALYKTFRMDTTTNLNHSCPYDHDLIVNHFRIDDNLNLYLPVGWGDYILDVYWLAYNVLRGIITITLRIE